MTLQQLIQDERREATSEQFIPMIRLEMSFKKKREKAKRRQLLVSNMDKRFPVQGDDN